MYAIVDIAGQQFKVEKGQKLYVHRLQGDEGSAVEFDKVLLYAGDDNKVRTGGLDKARISATILGHMKGDKVIVFKKKRRKGYRVKNGHRQSLTQVQINEISA
jgi:large subunit ribosomal protein L21